MSSVRDARAPHLSESELPTNHDLIPWLRVAGFEPAAIPKSILLKLNMFRDKLSETFLLTQHTSGLSVLMLCVANADETPAQHAFFKDMFDIFLIGAKDRKCILPLLRLKDSNQRTIFDWLKEKNRTDLMRSILHKLFGLDTISLGHANNSDIKTYLAEKNHLNGGFEHIDVAILDNVPLPETQKGFHCGYYAASLVTRYWHGKNPSHKPYPPRLFGDDKRSGQTSLKMLGKRAGIKGVGGIYDTRYFASILQDTPFQSQIMEFHSVDELRHLITKSIKNNCPIVFPVDWVCSGIGEADGKHSHYVTIIGFVSLGQIHHVYFITHDSLHSVPLNNLYESSDCLRLTPKSFYYKMPADTNGWKKAAKREDVPQNANKIYEAPDYNLEQLRRKMVLVYPRVLEGEFRKVFSADAALGKKL
jgi:hypothetical protein